MNAAVIGGAGLLGSAVVAELVRRDLFADIALLDAQAELAAAEIRDLREAWIDHPTHLHSASQIDSASQSDVIIFAGGFAPQSKETRLELARRYLRPFCWTLNALKQAGVKRDAVVIIAAEPSELLTAMAALYLDLPPSQILGMGTVIDTRRLRAALAEALGHRPTDIAINAIGTRGQDMVPLWSSASIAGAPIAKFKPWENKWQHEVETNVRTADTRLLRANGGAYRGTAAAVGEVATAIVQDTRAILPVCVARDFKLPKFNLRRTSVALPTIIGRHGAGDVVEQKLWPKEQAALQQAARHAQRDLRALADLA